MRVPAMVIAWLVGTAAAVAVSWLGVRTVVQDTMLPPSQLAVPAGTASTGKPPPLPPPTTTAPPATTTTTPPPTSASSPPPAANVHSYQVPGGQVVIALGADSATLVSATPANGYSMQVWHAAGWLRVDFSQGNVTSTVFVTWNGHPPQVQTYQS